ncbi:unnamed protein product [Adineta steineri]|uniref:RRM domain-containing protein n=1 Tax=Adineta steineri TaxID=433720 RepID=A0A819HFW9_9BILA|nr:unnamed protein product [Adineta steineri]CAF1397825.1 unnamed protein product [Adineta steineri]CAF3663755.1 unnamed protein product [Adineta steineri]CAF3895209.1 unnamed protein product [Adineta steineri]
MATPWCVKITCLPHGCDNDELANKFSVHPDTIDVPRTQSGPNYYAWVNGFTSEQQANEFVKRWNNEKVRTGTIKCKVAPTKAHMMTTRAPSVPRHIESRSRQTDNQVRNNRGQSVGYRRK